jgi:hypothetical protein
MRAMAVLERLAAILILLDTRRSYSHVVWVSVLTVEDGHRGNSSGEAVTNGFPFSPETFP